MRSSTVVRAAGRARCVSVSAVEKVAPAEVKDHLDRGFILVDIRDPEECAETGYKSSWKNIVVSTCTCRRGPCSIPGPHRASTIPPAHEKTAPSHRRLRLSPPFRIAVELANLRFQIGFGRSV
ncbi:hypothetical protein OAD67_00855 [bacterium]|nr:hypothetical protein [bacterium]